MGIRELKNFVCLVGIVLLFSSGAAQANQDVVKGIEPLASAPTREQARYLDRNIGILKYLPDRSQVLMQLFKVIEKGNLNEPERRLLIRAAGQLATWKDRHTLFDLVEKSHGPDVVLLGDSLGYATLDTAWLFQGKDLDEKQTKNSWQTWFSRYGAMDFQSYVKQQYNSLSSDEAKVMYIRNLDSRPLEQSLAVLDVLAGVEQNPRLRKVLVDGSEFLSGQKLRTSHADGIDEFRQWYSTVKDDSVAAAMRSYEARLGVTSPYNASDLEQLISRLISQKRAERFYSQVLLNANSGTFDDYGLIFPEDRLGDMLTTRAYLFHQLHVANFWMNFAEREDRKSGR